MDVLFEQDGSESRVKCTNALLLGNLPEPSDQTARKIRLRDKTNAGGF